MEPVDKEDRRDIPRMVGRWEVPANLLGLQRDLLDLRKLGKIAFRFRFSAAALRSLNDQPEGVYPVGL